MDAPDASDSESMASQVVVEIRDCLLCQAGECRVSNVREEVAANQIAVSALGVAVPFVPIGGEPLAAPLHDCHVIFLHTTVFLVNEQYHRKQEIATGKGGIFAGGSNCSE